MATSNACLPIVDTDTFDLWSSFFNEGLDHLETELTISHGNRPSTPIQLSSLSETLLTAVKLMTSFLAFAASLSSTAEDFESQRGRSAWLKSTITALRVDCHRYSWLVTQLATTMRSSSPKSKLPRASLETQWVEVSAAGVDMHGAGAMRVATTSAVRSLSISQQSASTVFTPSTAASTPMTIIDTAYGEDEDEYVYT